MNFAIDKIMTKKHSLLGYAADGQPKKLYLRAVNSILEVIDKVNHTI